MSCSYNYFAESYPDELWYSTLARNFFYSGLPNVSAFNSEHFGSKNLVHDLSLCRNLDVFLERHPFLTLDEIVRHTTIPLYLPFLDEKYRQLVKESLLQKGSRLHQYLGQTSKNNLIREMQYCPECVNSDLKRYKEAYLHRVHHLPGISTCPRHGLKILTYRPDPGTDITKSPEILNPEKLDLSSKILSSKPEIRLARLAEEFLDLPEDILSRSEIIKRINWLIEAEGYKTPRGRRLKELNRDITHYYGSKFMNKNGLCYENSKKNWISLMLNHSKILNPLYSMVLISFFCENLDSFLNVKEPDHDQLTEHLTCLNPVCPDHNKPVGAGNVYVLNNSEGRSVYRCPTCSQVVSNRNGKPNILQYGKLWDSKLREHAKSGVSRTESARILGIGRNHILEHLRKPHHSEFDEKIAKARNVFNEFVKTGKTSINDFDACHASEYNTLRLYDNKWFEDHRHLFKKKKPSRIPKGETLNGGGFRRNTSELDKKITGKLKAAHERLIRANVAFRITPKRLMVEAGYARSPKTSDLPETSRFLNQAEETREEFKLRIKQSEPCQKLYQIADESPEDNAAEFAECIQLKAA